MITKNEIPEHWEIMEIKDVIDTAKNGGTPKRSNDDYWGGDIGWLSSGEVTGREITEAEESITQLALDDSSTKLFPKNSVLVAMYGDGKTKGQSSILKKEMSGNQAICCLVPNENLITSEYLCHYFKCIKPNLVSEARGAGQDNLNQGMIKRKSIPVPPLDEQKNAVEYIESRLDNLNELDRLVQMFYSDIENYKESTLIHLISGKGLSDKDTIHGFPTEEDIPHDWDLVELSNAVNYHSNLVDPSKSPNEEFRLLELANVEKHTGKIVGTQSKNGSEIGSNKREFTSDHILYCKLRPYLNKVVCPEFSGIASTELMIFEPKDDFLKEYVHYYLLSRPVYERAESLMTGANHPRISKSSLMEFTIPKPPIKEQKQIVEKYNTIRQEYESIRSSVDNINNHFEEYYRSVLSNAFRGEFLDR